MGVRRLDGPFGRDFVEVLRTPYKAWARTHAGTLRNGGYLARVVQDHRDGDFKVFRSDMPPERWVRAPGFPAYQVSNYGRVRRWGRAKGATRGMVLATWMTGGRRPGQVYEKVGLMRDGKRKRVWVHRLVAKAFLGLPPFSGAQVHHKDDNRENNRAWNLTWLSHWENQMAKNGNGNGRPPGEAPWPGSDPIADRDLVDADPDELSSLEEAHTGPDGSGGLPY